MKPDDIKPGNFEFEYFDSIGNIKNIAYRLSSDFEGTMVFSCMSKALYLPVFLEQTNPEFQ